MFRFPCCLCLGVHNVCLLGVNCFRFSCGRGRLATYPLFRRLELVTLNVNRAAISGFEFLGILGKGGIDSTSTDKADHPE